MRTRIRRRIAGFTLIELMVTLAVAAVLTAIAIPSFVGMIRNNRGTSEANEFLSVLLLSRSEAIKRNRTVRICASTNGTVCDASAAWNEGFVVYTDLDGDATPDANEILRAQAPFTTASTITADAAFDDFIEYRSSGVSSASAAPAFTIKPADMTEYGRAIEVSATGRPRVTCASGATKCL